MEDHVRTLQPLIHNLPIDMPPHMYVRTYYCVIINVEIETSQHASLYTMEVKTHKGTKRASSVLHS